MRVSVDGPMVSAAERDEVVVVVTPAFGAQPQVVQVDGGAASAAGHHAAAVISSPHPPPGRGGSSLRSVGSIAGEPAGDVALDVADGPAVRELGRSRAFRWRAFGERTLDVFRPSGRAPGGPKSPEGRFETTGARSAAVGPFSRSGGGLDRELGSARDAWSKSVNPFAADFVPIRRVVAAPFVSGLDPLRFRAGPRRPSEA